MKYAGLIVAVVIAMAAAYFALQIAGEESPQTVVQQPTIQADTYQQIDAGVKEVDIYVAARDIPLGTVIDSTMITTQPWPEHLLVEGFYVAPDGGDQIIKTIARAPFRREEPITRAKVANPADPNFLAGDLPKGMRVVTMSTDEISAVAGFVFPGDRVDVLVTHEIFNEDVTRSDIEKARNLSELMEPVTEMLLQDIRVVAVDQRPTAGVSEEEGIQPPQSVSIEVTPEDAQRLRLASEVGELSLALRSVQDKETIEAVALTRKKDLTQSELPGTEEGKEKAKPIRIIRGTEIQVLEP